MSVLAAGPFDTIAGLPVHPLVVHFAVVLLPLAALALVVIVLVPRWRGTFGWLTLAGLAIGTGAAFVAKESGEALAARVGEPQQHAELGDILPLVAALLLLVAATWFLLWRRRTNADSRGGGPVVTVLGGAAALIAVGTIGLTIAVGHSGAEAVWGRTMAVASDASAAVPAPFPSPTTSTAPTESFTLADVAARATPAECWTVVDGTVYDLTSWIAEHPGGAEVIEGMCGIDATAAFQAEHGGQPEPGEELAQFAIGSLSSS